MKNDKIRHDKDRSESPVAKVPSSRFPAASTEGVDSTSKKLKLDRHIEVQAQYQKLESMGLMPGKVPERKHKRHSKRRARKSKTDGVPLELIAKHEWGALLHAFDEAVTPTSEAKTSPVETDVESDELWERLSGTQWLKDSSSLEADADAGPSSDPSTHTTLINRN